MRNFFGFLFLIGLVILLIGCSDRSNDQMGDIELVPLEVEFIVPESVAVAESIELKAIVTYGEDPVEDADEVVFEVWEKGNREDGEMIEGKHEGDGIYVAEVVFDNDGIFEMYAHTTARNMHTMP